MPSKIALIALSLTPGATTYSQEQTDKNQITSNKENYSPARRFRLALAKVRWYPTLVGPISRFELEKYAEYLTLSIEQEAFLDFLYEEYLKEIQSVIDEDLTQLAILSDFPFQQDYETADRYAAFIELRNNVFDKCVQSEAQLFARLKSVVADVQLPWFRRVDMHRERVRNRLCGQKITSAKLDLSRLFEEDDRSHLSGDINLKAELLRNFWNTLDDETLNAIDELRWEYEQKITPLFIRLAKELRGRESNYIKYVIDSFYDTEGNRFDRHSDEFSLNVAKTRIVIDDLLREGARLERHVRDVNREYVSRFVEALPENTGKAFYQLYLDVYPDHIYPDRTDPDDLFGSVLTSDQIERDLRILLGELWNTYRKQYDELCEEMRDIHDEWEEQYAEHSAQGRGLTRPYQIPMRELWIERWTLNGEFVKKLKPYIPPDVFTQYEHKFKMYFKSHSKAGNVLDDQYFPRS